MLKRYLEFLFCTIGAAMIGCSSPSITPETRVAGALQTLGRSADEFRANRQEVVRRRRALLADDHEEAAALVADTEQRIYVWKATGDTRRLSLYEQLLAGTRAAAEAWRAQQALERQEAQAIADADTQFALNEALLAKLVKSLTTLGTPASAADQVRSYVDFFVAIQGLVAKALADAANAAPDGDGGANALLRDRQIVRSALSIKH